MVAKLAIDAIAEVYAVFRNSRPDFKEVVLSLGGNFI
jgi:hypothetical protein